MQDWQQFFHVGVHGVCIINAVIYTMHAAEAKYGFASQLSI